MFGISLVKTVIICCSNGENVLYRVLRGISEEYLRHSYSIKSISVHRSRAGDAQMWARAPSARPALRPGDRPWLPGFRWGRLPWAAAPIWLPLFQKGPSKGSGLRGMDAGGGAGGRRILCDFFPFLRSCSRL